MINETLGSRIRARRHEMGWSLREMAKRVDRSPSYLSELERGLRGPGGDTLMHLSSAFGVTMDSLMMGNPNGKAESDPTPTATVEIPVKLSQFAQDTKLSHRRTMVLLQMAVVAQHSRGMRLTEFDWARFNEAIKDFIDE